MKKYLLILLGVVMSLSAVARDFEYTYEGQTLTYSVLDEDEKTCQTKAGEYLAAGNNISGDLIIPAEVSDGTSTYSVTAIGTFGFYDTGLTSVIIPNSVTSIDAYALAKCKGLTAVTMPNSVTSIGQYAFAWCSTLTTVTIPDSVTSIGNHAFYYCAGLTSVVISNSLTLIDEYTFANCSGLTTVTIPNSVTALGGRAFAWCGSLTTVTIPDSVTSIGTYAFYYCTGLTSVVIPNSITLIDECTFASCSGLTTVTIPNSVTALGDKAFAWCDGLTTVTIPGSVTSIGDYAFYYCNGLKEINYITKQPVAADSMVFSYDTYKMATLNVAYGGLDNAKSTEPWKNFVNIQEEGILRQDGVIYTLFTPDEGEPYAEVSGNYLTENIELVIPSPVTKSGVDYPVTAINSHAFMTCLYLYSIDIPNSVTTIGDFAFTNCMHMASVVIPNSVTTISYEAFSFCTALTSLTIPNSVDKIGDFAFANCYDLMEINYDTTNPIAANKNVFSDETYSIASLIVDAGGSDNAKLTEPWKYFENITEKVFSSINEVIDNFEVNAPIEVYDLNGVYVANTTDDLAPGIYIIRQASKVSKIAVK